MIAPWIYVGIKGSERAKKKQTLDNFEANFLWFKHKIKLMGHGELRFTERESKKREKHGEQRGTRQWHFVRIKFSNNWAVCSF